jgi:hypothetical protein
MLVCSGRSSNSSVTVLPSVIDLHFEFFIEAIDEFVTYAAI